MNSNKIIIDISDICDKEIGSSKSVNIKCNFDLNDPEIQIAKPIKGLISITNIGNSVLLDGKLTTSAKLKCDRCLKNYSKNVNIEIAGEFSKNQSDENVINSDGTVNLTKIILDELLLSIPLKSLCKKNCKILNYN